VLREQSTLCVDKLRLRGFETPFGYAPFDDTDVYLNAFRGVLADQSSLLRSRKFGRNLLSYRGHRKKQKSSKDD
jgi:hypothetical protein